MSIESIKDICNIAAYKFITIEEDKLSFLGKRIKAAGIQNALKGTILFSTEGINLFLAGTKNNIERFQNHLRSYELFGDLSYKYSYSSFVPFKKLFVKVRKEIVTFRQFQIQPEKFTAPYITPLELKSRLDAADDIVLLDTRNNFEYQIGSFKNALHLNIDNFREFPDALDIAKLNPSKPVVTFCTGGIRCEKAAAYLLEKGFKEVYQLQGGILNYFEHCKDDHYEGNCFVFDDRGALNPALEVALMQQSDTKGKN